jgi:hypothetical protein
MKIDVSVGRPDAKNSTISKKKSVSSTHGRMTKNISVIKRW